MKNFAISTKKWTDPSKIHFSVSSMTLENGHFHRFFRLILICLFVAALKSSALEARRYRDETLKSHLSDYLIQHREIILSNEGKLYLKPLYDFLGITSEEKKEQILLLLGDENFVKPLFSDANPDNKEFFQVVKIDQRNRPLFDNGELVFEEKYLQLRGNVHNSNAWHATVHILILDPHGKVIIQSRGVGQGIVAGGKQDISVSGHKPVGLNFKEAVIKEVEEEIGLIISPDRLQEINVGNNVSYGNGYYLKIGSPQSEQIGWQDGVYYYGSSEAENPNFQNYEVSKFYILVLGENESPHITEETTGLKILELDVVLQDMKKNPSELADTIRQYFSNPLIVDAIRDIVNATRKSQIVKTINRLPKEVFTVKKDESDLRLKMKYYNEKEDLYFGKCTQNGELEIIWRNDGNIEIKGSYGFSGERDPDHGGPAGASWPIGIVMSSEHFKSLKYDEETKTLYVELSPELYEEIRRKIPGDYKYLDVRPSEMRDQEPRYSVVFCTALE